MKNTVPLKEQKNLLKWFEREKRSLPWRKIKDPYAIWISEVMLQQTTTKAVIPFYKRFLKTFPHVRALAKATEKTVYPLWAGLGYYQRARNLIKAAKEIEKRGEFPSSYRELIQLPGFGPYTARAVSSLAFEEPVGIVDGNVIRFLSRFHGLNIKWWTAGGRKRLQELSNKWVENQQPSRINQALMEIGSLICASPSPFCLLCPVREGCRAFKNKTQDRLPLKRPKKTEEMFHWKPLIVKKNGRVAFVPNTFLPFLKGRPVFPGRIKKIPSPPARFHFCHSIMHYKIYVTVQSMDFKKAKKYMVPQKREKKPKGNKLKENFIWLKREKIKEQNPSSLLQKALNKGNQE